MVMNVNTAVKMKLPLNTQHAATAPMVAPNRILRRGFRCFLLMRTDDEGDDSVIVVKALPFFSDMVLVTEAAAFPLDVR